MLYDLAYNVWVAVCDATQSFFFKNNGLVMSMCEARRQFFLKSGESKLSSNNTSILDLRSIRDEQKLIPESDCITAFIPYGL